MDRTLRSVPLKSTHALVLMYETLGGRVDGTSDDKPCCSFRISILSVQAPQEASSWFPIIVPNNRKIQNVNNCLGLKS